MQILQEMQTIGNQYQDICTCQVEELSCGIQKKQNMMALSSTKAEYTVISHATRQAIWLQNLLEGLGYPQEELTILYSDNQSAITLIQDTQFHARSKHFDMQNHFDCEKVENGVINIIYVPTDNIVDVFTKTLLKPKHQKFRENLGMLTAWGGVLEWLPKNSDMDIYGNPWHPQVCHWGRFNSFVPESLM